MDNYGWWDYLKADSPSKIQWTPANGGIVKARLDSLTPWAYQKCGDARNATGLGEGIIERQKIESLANVYRDSNIPRH